MARKVVEVNKDGHWEMESIERKMKGMKRRQKEKRRTGEVGCVKKRKMVRDKRKSKRED